MVTAKASGMPSLWGWGPNSFVPNSWGDSKGQVVATAADGTTLYTVPATVVAAFDDKI